MWPDMWCITVGSKSLRFVCALQITSITIWGKFWFINCTFSMWSQTFGPVCHFICNKTMFKHSDTLFFFCVPDWYLSTWTTAARKCHLYFPLETKPNQCQSVNSTQNPVFPVPIVSLWQVLIHLNAVYLNRSTYPGCSCCSLFDLIDGWVSAALWAILGLCICQASKTNSIVLEFTYVKAYCHLKQIQWQLECVFQMYNFFILLHAIFVGQNDGLIFCCYSFWCFMNRFAFHIA